MPENIIQKADKYIADKVNNGTVTTKITENVHSTPEMFDRTLNTMYADQYRSVYKSFDEFKSAYQASYGDPFKKKAQPEPEKVAVPHVAEVQKVSTFQPSEERSQISVEEATAPLSVSAKQSEQQAKQAELYSSGLLTTAEPGQINPVSTGQGNLAEGTLERLRSHQVHCWHVKPWQNPCGQ